MKTSFEFSLKGRDWWGPFIGFWVIFLAIYIPQITMTKWGPSSAEHPGLYFFLAFVFMFLVVIVQSVFTIVFARILMPKLSWGGKAFGFDGSIGELLGINVLGLILSIITIFIYTPWYMKRVVSYMVSETTVDGQSAEFFGKGGKLFVYCLLSFFIPLIVVCVLFAVIAGTSLTGANMDSGSPLSVVFVTVLVVVIFFILTPFMYLTMKWYTNVGWKDLRTTWGAAFWPSCGFLLGQMALTIITIGIYGPAALLRCYRYFAPKIGLNRGDLEAGRLGFDGEIGKGFGLLWGQGLLSIITLGIYIPWAYARIGAWMASHTFIEKSA